jgi:hypothetical protein
VLSETGEHLKKALEKAETAFKKAETAVKETSETNEMPKDVGEGTKEVKKPDIAFIERTSRTSLMAQCAVKDSNIKKVKEAKAPKETNATGSAEKKEKIDAFGDNSKKVNERIVNVTESGNKKMEGVKSPIREVREASEKCDDIDEQQKKSCKEAIERIEKGEKLTTEELGNFGEMMMDQYYVSEGYKPLNRNRVTNIHDKKSGFKTGIDGVYEKINSDGTKSYIIAEAKYNTAQLSETSNNVRQMSDTWIDARLADAVGKEKAKEIIDVAEDNPELVSHEVYHVQPSNDVDRNMYADIQKVDSDGNKVGEKTIVEYFDKNGNRIEETKVS